MAGNPTIGQIIKRIHSNEISSSYSLFGNDSFLQDFFVKELDKFYLGGSGNKKHFILGDDKQQELLKSLFSVSLFSDRELFIVRQIKKIIGNDRDELVNYLQNPNMDKCLVLISEDFDDRNTFQKILKKHTLFIDVRVPFPSKMFEWVQFISKSRGYKINRGTILNLIELYGDSIAHVINEIDKISLMVGKEVQIDDKVIEQTLLVSREYNVWQLQDMIGRKNLKQSIVILKSLIYNGVSIPQLIISLSNLFEQLLWHSMGNDKITGYTGLNKIISNNIKNYSNNYSKDEIEKALLELRKLDMLSKTTSLSPISIVEPAIIKICEDLYA